MAEEFTRYITSQYEVETTSDIPFGEVTDERGQLETLLLDVYQPADGDQALRPAVLWFHGGGFRPPMNRRQNYIPRFAGAFACMGYVGIAPDYRVRVDPLKDKVGTVRDAVADARLALNWAREHSQAYRIDPQRIILAGGSAGGMVVLNLVHDPAKPLNGQTHGIFAVLDLWGTPGPGFRLFQKVNPASPATLIVHGTADELVPYANSLAFRDELTQAGVDNLLLTLPGAPHTPLMHMQDIVAFAARFLHDRM